MKKHKAYALMCLLASLPVSARGAQAAAPDRFGEKSFTEGSTHSNSDSETDTYAKPAKALTQFWDDYEELLSVTQATNLNLNRLNMHYRNLSKFLDRPTNNCNLLGRYEAVQCFRTVCMLTRAVQDSEISLTHAHRAHHTFFGD
jgi:hypothetical protein